MSHTPSNAIPVPSLPTTVWRTVRPAVILAVMVATADWLFFDQAFGAMSVLVFALALVSALLANPITSSKPTLAGLTIVLLLSLLPVFEDYSILSVAFALLGAAYVARTATKGMSGTWTAKLSSSARMIVSGPIWASIDVTFVKVPDSHDKAGAAALARSFSVWLLPLGMGTLFTCLFVSANPVFESLIPRIDLNALLLAIFNGPRLLFWLGSAAATWAFVAVRPQRIRAPIKPAEHPISPQSSLIFGQGSMVRSLIVFNLIFAVQSATDVAYLWGGAALPVGTTYAEYAHRGAFPLIVTALLAGAFVILAMQPGSAAESSRLMRGLVFAWIAQNVLLVSSTILRLDLYVSVYSLTMWRVAAFIWMGLVAGGLVLIVVRVALRWSNSWLVDANLAMLVATLYACCFVNFTDLIARYTIDHASHTAGTCGHIDIDYLISLGSETIPALDSIERNDRKVCDGERRALERWRGYTTFAQERNSTRNWRAWNYRHWRLLRYLQTHPAYPPLSNGPPQ